LSRPSSSSAGEPQDRCTATCPTWYTRPLTEREPHSGLGGPMPASAQQAQGRERSTPIVPLSPPDVRRPQRASSYRQRCQCYWILHNNNDYRARSACELGGCVRGKSVARRGATTQGKAAAAAATSLHHKNGRIHKALLAILGVKVTFLR